MGNTNTKDIGKFQSNVGKVGADISLITSVIIAVFLILVSIVLTILAFIPAKPSDCPDVVDSAKKQRDIDCSSINEECDQAKETLSNAEKHCATKRSRYELLYGLLLIPIALLIVGLAYWWKQEVNTSKTAAQVGGALFEIGMLQDIFGGS